MYGADISFHKSQDFNLSSVYIAARLYWPFHHLSSTDLNLSLSHKNIDFKISLRQLAIHY